MSCDHLDVDHEGHYLVENPLKRLSSASEYMSGVLRRERCCERELESEQLGHQLC
jgi:hypothetical protein